MSKLGRHNPLTLPKEPDWTNDQGTKWWGLDVGDPTDGSAAYVEAANGGRMYVILDEGGVIYETKSLEGLCFEFDKLRILRVMK
jgi:hypothetical protein